MIARPSLLLRSSLLVVVVLAFARHAAPARADFVNFESGQVRPIALSPDGSRLFVTNTPDNRLEIFSLATGSPVFQTSVPVGLEPVAVAARSDGEVWVVNHLSDSISIVDVASSPPRVVRTLLVGDEPRDILFAGPSRSRAFITAAHRGQNRPGDPQLTTPGIGRADVWVFDTAALGARLGGTPLTILSLFGDTPRALASSPDGSIVYAAVFQSGNRTTALSEGAVCNGGSAAPPCMVGGLQVPGGLPAPNVNYANVPQPEVGLIVKYDPDAAKWLDELGRNWNNAVKFSLPDLDVFEIDAMATPPVEVASHAGVGTVLFDMAVNPVSGKVYVSNTEARNEVRFEGPGDAFGSTTVRSHLHEARITVIDGATVTPRHLNKHIDYAVVPSDGKTKRKSLATPVGLAVSGNGAKLYVAGFGSSRVGVYKTRQIEQDTFVPSPKIFIPVTGGGPTGLALDEARGRLYVLTRFDNALSVIDTAAAAEIDHLPLYNPEPAAIVAGRPMLYDARFTSSNGEASCSSCHVFGDNDSLAWDLGNPDDDVLQNKNPFEFEIQNPRPDFHPLKGPMTTQSLRGMAHSGPMHWRGDRSGANDPGGTTPDALDEEKAFKRFNPAFVGLVGRATPLADADMQAFTDFILTVQYPPNPIRALDNVMTASQQAGHDLYMNPSALTDTVRNCNGCHVLDPSQGFFGTDGEASFENETQLFKVAHLRNAYTKVGMFGLPDVAFIAPTDHTFQGEQIRGFGFLHDGSIDTVGRFLHATVFGLNDTQRTNLEQFVLAFDSDLAPVVGQQVTRNRRADGDVDARLDLLIARAAAGECDLVAKGNLAGEARGWVRQPGGQFRSDRASEPLVGRRALRQQSQVAGQEVTFTCAPLGSGQRIGIDRDGDGAFDRDELDGGSNPADPASLPACLTLPGGATEGCVIGGG
jgi:DNA-binding beta-propeller fold protein YncE